MHYNPALQDVFIASDKSQFKLSYADQQRVLLTPVDNLDQDAQLIAWDCFKQKLQSAELRPTYSINQTIEQYTEYQKKEAKKREPYIDEIYALYESGHRPTSKVSIELVKEAVLLEHNIGKKKYGYSTICRWWKQFKDADFQLLPSITDRKTQSKRLSTASEHFLSRHLSKAWVKGSASNTSKAYRRYLNKAEIAAESNSAIEVVCESTFRNRLKDFNQFEVDLNSSNHSKIAKALRTLCKKIHVDRVLERVEMDRLCLNLALIDENGKPTGNVSLYIALDCYSRYPLSVTYELGNSEDSEGVLRSLKYTITRATEGLIARGKPDQIVVDNGPGYKSEVFRYVTSRLGIELVKAPPNQPWRKPFVESFNNTIRMEFCEGATFQIPDGTDVQGLPGYLGKKASNKVKPLSEETVKKAARLSISDFERELHNFLRHYVNSVHSSLNGKTPQQVWNESIEQTPIVDINDELLYQAFHCFESKVKLSERGTVQVDKQVFADRRLKQLFLDAKTIDKKQDLSVIVQFDKDDARFVTVIAKFDSLNSDRVIENVPNRSLRDTEFERAVSFEALNCGHNCKTRRDIYNGKLENIKKVKARKRSSGKEVDSSRKNAKSGLSIKDRIQNSNDRYSPNRKYIKTASDIRSDTPPPKSRKVNSRKSRQESTQFDLWDEDAV